MIIDKTDEQFDDVPASLEGEVLLRRVYDSNDKLLGFETCPCEAAREFQLAGPTMRQRLLSDPDAINPVLDTLSIPAERLPVDLTEYKTRAKATINAEAANARARYISVDAGQDIIYENKLKQAQAYKDAGYPANATPYPFVQAQANARGMTAQEAADYILTRAAILEAKGAQIEEIRDGKGKAIDDAATFDEAAQAKLDALEQLQGV